MAIDRNIPQRTYLKQITGTRREMRSPDHRLHGGEQPGRVFDEARKHKLKAALLKLGSNAKGLRVSSQSRLGLSDGDI